MVSDLDTVTCVLCNYKTAELTSKAVESLKTAYPNVGMVVVDNGSKDGSTDYIRTLPDKYPDVGIILNPANYGHGPALHQAMEACETRFAFALDSDCEVIKGGFLEPLLAAYADSPQLYAHGLYVEVTGQGVNTGHGIPYGHPQSCLYDREKYFTLPPFAHHGAPCIYNMVAAQRAEYEVRAFPILDYITHLGEGTRAKVGGWSPAVVARPVREPQPWLSFVTRCYKRPAMLLHLLETIAEQTCGEYENVLLVDAVGHDVTWANAQFEVNKYRVHGRYVYLIDDDDEVIEPELVACVKRIGQTYNPDIIQFRFEHPGGHVMPPDELWEKPPQGGRIGGSSYVVRLDVWRRHIKYFSQEWSGESYAGDWGFIRELWKHNYSVYWCDCVIGRAGRQHLGLPEGATQAQWQAVAQRIPRRRRQE